jgi:predicted ATPase
VGSRGEYAPEVLYRLDDAETKKQINRWLNQFGLGRSYTFSELGMEAFSLLFERKPGLPVNISDTGFGVSQVMPFIVQTAVEEPTLLITEQPEIHLNPRLQSLLADLFLDLAERRHYVLAETHSEHLVLRLRRLIAEGQIASSRVALYYVAWNEGESEVRRVPIDDSGYIDPADWPSGFFDESLSQAVGLAAAQRGRAKNAR